MNIPDKLPPILFGDELLFHAGRTVNTKSKIHSISDVWASGYAHVVAGSEEVIVRIECPKAGE